MYSNRAVLRNYQEKLAKQLTQLIENTCIQSDTGTGKSVVMMDYVLKQVENGFNVLIIVPSIELIDNLEKYVKSFAPIIYRLFYGVINSKRKFEPGKRLYIGTYGSIAKYHGIIKPDIIILDECHHLRARTYEKHLQYWHDKRHIGFTATPIRYDGKSLKKYLPNLICSESTEWFIDNGYLSKYKVYTDPLSVQFVSSTGRDELDKQQKLWDKYDLIANAYQTWKRLSNNEQTIIFTTGVEHANQVCEEYGSIARVVVGDTPNRDKILTAFDNKEFPVLINVNLLTEGVDVKECTTVQLLRKTYSYSLYRQAIGRGLRIDPNNPNKILKILDHAGNIQQHGEPALPIDWYELYNNAESVKVDNFNKESLDYTCEACTYPIAKLGEIKGNNTIICPLCGHINVIKALTVSQIKQLQIADKIDLVEYSIPLTIQQIERVIASKKMNHQVKIKAILDIKKATPEQKLAGLQKLGMDLKLAKVYLGV